VWRVYVQHVMRIAFHKSSPILAASTVTGEVGIYEYGIEGNTQRALLQHHQMSTRALTYSHDGDTLFMGSKDCNISAYDLAGRKRHLNMSELVHVCHRHTDVQFYRHRSVENNGQPSSCNMHITNVYMRVHIYACTYIYLYIYICTY